MWVAGKFTRTQYNHVFDLTKTSLTNILSYEELGNLNARVFKGSYSYSVGAILSDEQCSFLKLKGVELYLLNQFVGYDWYELEEIFPFTEIFYETYFAPTWK